MATKKKSVKKKSKTPTGKAILFLHVGKTNKVWFRKVTGKVASKTEGRVTLSIVADRMLTNIKKSPALLKAALK